MKDFFPRVPFYFLRHGETNHNVHGVYDDFNEPELNETGINQSIKMRAILASLDIATVCSSPLIRVQQTKMVALEGKTYQDKVLDDLRECPSELWRLFLASETRSLNVEEWNSVYKFVDRVKNALGQALKFDHPLLLIAHGGTYWAIAHLFELPGDRKISNCVLTKIIPDSANGWTVNPMLEV